ncbi:stromal membrane-associated protein 1 isoform x1 [Limosa lapponica baueri]|uniref:Stromal membrane-associated protein 1 isoform x1 n=1 Tax=Limosa lapponica baueri TaxID=1758121 RepID=A0A2I0U4L5_LIMLA|nr:stromal membrane-associated protein 1 isoform x1 [Limosa lapponica baueri]
MATRSCREKAQKQNEQHQAILAKLLREEDNKYCADCEAKAVDLRFVPKSPFVEPKLMLSCESACFGLNTVEKEQLFSGLKKSLSMMKKQQLGRVQFSKRKNRSLSEVFEDVGPRCAGIHRNLGVHISRVKSVNLDQWTPEQIQCMQEMGNTKARLLYEANLPENFRRPQTDQAVEFFIRDKYEKKKYYDKNAANAFNISSSDAAQPLASSPSLQAAAEKSKAEKKEDQQSEAKASPKKSSEPTIDLLGLDGPAEGSVTNGGTAAVTALNDDLDIFGPMISNPLPAAAVPPAQSTSTKPAAASLSAASGDLDLFTEQTTKSEELAKKQLSKDSILSLYGTGTLQQQSAPGMFMGSSSMPFTTQPSTHFQGFPAMGVPVPAATGMMGNMMGQSVPVMGQSTGVMVGMGMPNGFTGTTQTGVMGLPQNVVGPQSGMVGQMVTPQNKYGLQQNQQAQWNLSQMNQQMAGMNLSSSSNVMGFGQPPSTAAGWTGTSSGQTLSTQLWK